MVEYIDEKSLYGTTDFLTASCLLYFDHHIEALDKREPSRCTFFFKREAYTDEILGKFYKGQLLCEPKRFYALQKELKGRLYN